jgi:hypothetical protein
MPPDEPAGTWRSATSDGSVQVIMPAAYDSERFQVVLHRLQLPAALLPPGSIMPTFSLAITDTQTGLPVTACDPPITLVIRPERSAAELHLFYRDEGQSPHQWYPITGAVQRAWPITDNQHAIELHALPGTSFVLVQPVPKDSEQTLVYLPIMWR